MLRKLMLKSGVLIMIGWLILAPAGAQAVDLGALIDLLQEKGVLTAEEASELRKRPMVDVPPPSSQYQRPPIAASSSRNDGAVRLSASPSDMAQGPMEEPSVDLPGWLKRIKIGGDIRLRYQNDLFADNNVTGLVKPSDPTKILNTTEDRQRFRYRARLSLTAQVNDDLKAAFRLATGNDEDPISTNDTLGDTFNKDNVLFDRAYLEWQPTSMLTVTGGRIPNPWVATDLVWDKDLNFEGLAVTYRQRYLDWLSGFATAGAFPVQEVELSDEDKWLYGGQIGVNIGRKDRISSGLAVAYYHFENTTGKVSATGSRGEFTFTSPGFQQKGNTLFYIDPDDANQLGLATDFQELDILATLDIGFWDPIHFVLFGNYVKNLGFDAEEVTQRTGVDVDNTDTGYMFGAAVGYPKVTNWGQWSAYAFYKYLEADAVMDGFTDSDFHLGGTNAKGWIFGGELGLMKNTWLSAKWQSADEIEGLPLGIDVLQVDLNAKF